MASTTTTHVIFDLGGIIINSPVVLRSIFTKVANNYEKQFLPELEKRVADIEDINLFVNEFLDSLDLDKEINFRNKLIETMVNEIINSEFDLIPGVDRLVKHLYRNNIPMAIATNSTKPAFIRVCKNLTNYLEKYFSHWVCGADDPEVKSNKPKPDVYTVCAKRFQTKPKSIENCVIFEDSMTGITGAVASGMKTVLINDRTVLSFESIADKITVIVDTFNDFKPESVGLPTYL